MPSYDFRCGSCGAERKAVLNYGQSRTLELFCASCGGVMTVAPVLAVNVIRPAHAAPASGSGTEGARKSCGCAHACRCVVKLDRPNPFRPELQKESANA